MEPQPNPMPDPSSQIPAAPVPPASPQVVPQIAQVKHTYIHKLFGTKAAAFGMMLLISFVWNIVSGILLPSAFSIISVFVPFVVLIIWFRSAGYKKEAQNVAFSVGIFFLIGIGLLIIGFGLCLLAFK